MADDTTQSAWQKYCGKLKPLGVNPYSEVPADDPRYERVQAIREEHEGVTKHKLSLPGDWEGRPPICPIDSLWNLSDLLEFHWNAIRMAELGGGQRGSLAVKDGARAIRNAYRVLTWLGVQNYPEPPLPTNDPDVIKKQLNDLGRWLRNEHLSGRKLLPKKVKFKPSKYRGKFQPVDKGRMNLFAADYLKVHPGATIRELETALQEKIGEGSIGTLQSLDAWREEMARRNAKKPPPKTKTKERPLTDGILVAMPGRDVDPADKVMNDDSTWHRLIQNAKDSEQRAQLHAMSSEKRAQLIEQVQEQNEDDDQGADY